MQFVIYNVDRCTNPKHYAQILEHNGYKIGCDFCGTDVYGNPSYRWIVDVDSVENLVKISDIVTHQLIISSKNDDAYNWRTDGKYDTILIYDGYME